MKPLKEMSWLHLKPTENLRDRRSNPSLKASSTIYLQSGKANASRLSFRRLSEGTSSHEEPIQELSPRPEPDSGRLTPEPMPLTPNPDNENSAPSLESCSGNNIPEHDAEAPNPQISTKDLEKLENIFSAYMRDRKENSAETSDIQRSPSPQISAKELSTSLEGLQKAVTDMGLRGSHNISPHSISLHSADSINDLIQSRPDSPEPEHPLGPLQIDYRWRPSKRMTRIDVSESSIDENMNVFLPLSSIPNAASVFPSIQTVTSNYPVMVKPDMPQRTFDGPASIATLTTDLSHMPGDCPPISEVDEAQYDMSLPCKTHDLTIPAVPGVPIDSTGLAAVPTTPPSNLNKRQKMRVKGQRLVRLGRRVVMRKSVLIVILGRQLAGPTVLMLETISKTGTGVIPPASSTAPDSVPMTM